MCSGDDFVAEFADRRPADGRGGVGGGFAHQIGRFTEEENLDFVAGFGEGESVGEDERGAGGVVGAPGAFHHDFEGLFGLVGFGAEGEKRQACELGEEFASGHVESPLVGIWVIGDLRECTTAGGNWKMENGNREAQRNSKTESRRPHPPKAEVIFLDLALLFDLQLSTIDFPRLLREDGEVGPARDGAEDQGDQGDGGEIEQPVADARIEERRGIVGIGLVTMEKTVGNVRHSHDNLLARAAWAAHGQAIEGTLSAMYSHATPLSRVGFRAEVHGVAEFRRG